ncbi:hypothetical protein HBB16_04670 [Pseudonocardia sp. MCCB 268]|nr:hypothetical protein [Pseudonocardia cytotoxica]
MAEISRAIRTAARTSCRRRRFRALPSPPGHPRRGGPSMTTTCDTTTAPDLAWRLTSP